jgi:hypothetical protein
MISTGKPLKLGSRRLKAMKNSANSRKTMEICLKSVILYKNFECKIQKIHDSQDKL